jgi:hypothetical protein
MNYLSDNSLIKSLCSSSVKAVNTTETVTTEVTGRDFCGERNSAERTIGF